MKTVLTGANIIKSYGEGAEKRNVIDGVSIETQQGELVAVMGPSGSGKSTLLFALSGMDSVDAGSISFAGKNLAETTEKQLTDVRRNEMGIVFQQPTMLKNLNLLDNIILPSMRSNRKNVVAITQKARELMARMGIAELENRDITQVSGGQLQRAGICRALMSEPKILFGDEPTGALNSRSAQEIMEIFCEINAGGTAIFLVTHDAKIASRAQRVLFMCDGKIVSEMQLSPFAGGDIEARTQLVADKMREIGI